MARFLSAFFALHVSLCVAIDYRCGSMQVQPCPISHQGIERHGFLCPAGGHCLDRRNWCSLSGFVENQQCKNSENLMFDRCLSIEKTIDGISYHVNIAQVHWIVAEQYCQSHRMNLVSFANQQEYDHIIDLLKSISEDPMDIPAWGGGKFKDPLSQRCWAVKAGFGAPSIYWSGLFFDESTQTWNYSDGSKVNQSIRAGSVRLSDALSRHTPKSHLGYVGIVDKNYDFIVERKSSDHRRIDSFGDRARIICNAGKVGTKGRKWSAGLDGKNSGCLTGFRCSGRKSKCITGIPFQNSGVCNGSPYCIWGDDESPTYCPILTMDFPDNNRIAHFHPRRTTVKVARSICEKSNFTLPSIHSSADIEFLQNLPKAFVKTRSPPDFILASENWFKMSWKILLGVRRDSETWDDGYPIGYLEADIRNLPSNNDVYMIYNTTTHGKLAALFDQKDDIFPVCEERRSNIIPIPAVIMVPANTATGVSSIALFMALSAMIVFHESVSFE